MTPIIGHFVLLKATASPPVSIRDESNCPGFDSSMVLQTSKCQTQTPFKSMGVKSVKSKMSILWAIRQRVVKKLEWEVDTVLRNMYKKKGFFKFNLARCSDFFKAYSKKKLF